MAKKAVKKPAKKPEPQGIVAQLKDYYERRDKGEVR